MRPAAGLLVLAFLAGACAAPPRLERLDFERSPPAAAWGPHAVPMEWWYVAVTDRAADRSRFEERGPFPWCGLHLDDGSDLMLFDLRGLHGAERQLTATATDDAGAVRALPALRMRATGHVTSSTGRRWPTAWRVEGEGWDLEVEALRTRQEFVSRGACTTYWEGPVRVRGSRDGRPVAGRGLAESVARTPLSRARPRAAAPPPPAGAR